MCRLLPGCIFWANARFDYSLFLCQTDHLARAYNGVNYKLDRDEYREQTTVPLIIPGKLVCRYKSALLGIKPKRQPVSVVEQLYARKISTVCRVLAAVAGEHVLDVYRPCTGAPIVPTVTQLARAHTDCGSAGWLVIKSQLFFAIPTMFQLMVTLRK